MTDEGAGERPGYWQRRRARALAELARNREGGHRIPTWVMVAALLAELMMIPPLRAKVPAPVVTLPLLIVSEPTAPLNPFRSS